MISARSACTLAFVLCSRGGRFDRELAATAAQRSHDADQVIGREDDAAGSDPPADGRHARKGTVLALF